MHHLNLLQSERSLQECGLSKLGPLAKKALDQVFARREAMARAAEAGTVTRAKKMRYVDGEEVEVQEKVPVFLKPRPFIPEDDPSPFMVSLGLRNRNTIVGSPDAAMEWSRTVISPRDQDEIVEGSTDHHINVMGSQIAASVNTYFRALQHNLHQARTDLTIAERDRDRYLRNLEAQQEQYRTIEQELAEEKELCHSLESQLTLDRAQVIMDWRESEEFATVLDEEYAAAFPVTFRSTWTQAVEFIGASVPEVTLVAFPVLGDTPPQGNTAMWGNTSDHVISPPHGDILDEDQEYIICIPRSLAVFCIVG